MYILQARITIDWKDNLDQSSETSNVFKQSSTHMPPQTGVTLAKYAFFLWGWKPLKGDPPTSFDDQTLPNQLLHQYSLFTTTLSKKIMGQFFLPHFKKPILLLGCGPLWRTSHCGRLGQVTLLLSYIFGGIPNLRVHECKNNPFILLGEEKWANLFLHAFLYLPDDFGVGKTLFWNTKKWLDHSWIRFCACKW